MRWTGTKCGQRIEHTFFGLEQHPGRFDPRASRIAFGPQAGTKRERAIYQEGSLVVRTEQRFFERHAFEAGPRVLNTRIPE
jgi:hypothetical protein